MTWILGNLCTPELPLGFLDRKLVNFQLRLTCTLQPKLKVVLVHVISVTKPVRLVKISGVASCCKLPSFEGSDLLAVPEIRISFCHALCKATVSVCLKAGKVERKSAMPASMRPASRLGLGVLVGFQNLG